MIYVLLVLYTCLVRRWYGATQCYHVDNSWRVVQIPRTPPELPMPSGIQTTTSPAIHVLFFNHLSQRRDPAVCYMCHLQIGHSIKLAEEPHVFEIESDFFMTLKSRNHTAPTGSQMSTLFYIDEHRDSIIAQAIHVRPWHWFGADMSKDSTILQCLTAKVFLAGRL